MKSLNPYAKAIVPLIIGFATTLVQAVAANEFNRTTLAAALVTLLTAFSVWFVPNTTTPYIP